MESTLPDNSEYLSERDAWLWVNRVIASLSLSVVVFLVAWSAMAMASAGRTSVSFRVGERERYVVALFEGRLLLNERNFVYICMHNMYIS